MKRVAQAVLLISAGSALALGLTEIVLRLLDLAPTRGLTTVTAEQFDRQPGLFKAHDEFTDRRNRALPHHVRINALGFRGPDFPFTPEAGVLRVAILGDSFAYGDFVDNDKTLPAQLQSRLAMQCGEVEVINAGLPGSTITEQRRIAQRIMPLRPALVILTFTENDVSDLSDEPMWNQLARNRELKSGAFAGLVYPLLRGSALWHLGMQVRGRIRAGRRHDEAAVQVAAGNTMGGVRPDSALRARYTAELRLLAAELRAASIPAIFLTFPAHFTVYGEWSDEQLRWVEATAMDADLPVISTLRELQATGKPAEELFLLPHDGHPSAQGYSVAADKLALALEHSPVIRTFCQEP